MLEELKQRVLLANKSLKTSGLVTLTWGNASAFDAAKRLVAIKPSGVPYDELTLEDIVIVDLSGNVVEGTLRPSSDCPTHLKMYQAHPELGGIIHTHSTFATAFAQAKRPIPPYGTTHADAFYGEVPCARLLSKKEIKEDYEGNTGKVIVEALENRDPFDVPAILLPSHGVFTWGKSVEKAFENAVTLEEVAKMAYLTETICPKTPALDPNLMEKHHKRKHGSSAYYGQK
ncbi:MAG: L-ribulose-5-phosphate 4-epimerase AraD [Bacilli bacterium]|nr:L-ribulose-5-phosphate 4-epimerase AraD [Bacilli bacterium]